MKLASVGTLTENGIHNLILPRAQLVAQRQEESKPLEL